MAIGLTELISSVNRTGILDFILPFIIVYIILFAVFRRAQIIPDKRLNIILSLSIAALITFSPAGLPLITFFKQIFTSTVVLLVFLVIFVAVAFLIGIARSPKPSGEPEPEWLLIIAAIIAFYLLTSTNVLTFLGLPAGAFPIPPFIFVLLGVIAVIMLILKYAK